MKRRVLVLPIAAVIIIACVAARLMREPRSSRPVPPVQRCPAPSFELYDHHRQLVKFQRYLGRQRLVVVFFDGAAGVDASAWLTALADAYDAVSSTGTEVIAISTATGYAVRQAEERVGRPFPFPVLTDIDPQGPTPIPVHRLWGMVDGEQAPRFGLFLVDRAGRVACRDGRYLPETSPDTVIAELIRGEWPAGAGD